MKATAAPSRRERNRRELRTQILAAARELFTVRGPENVTVTEVAEHAGVARATVFNHFSSKHALVEAITEEVFDYYGGMLETALADTTSSTPTLVRALFEQMGFGIEQTRRFHSGVFREIARIQVGLDEGGGAARARERALALLVRLLGRGLERGELVLGHSPRQLASAFDALANGTLMQWLYEDSSESLRLRMRRAAEIFLGSVVADDCARRCESEALPVLLPTGLPFPIPGLPFVGEPAPEETS